MVGKVAAGGVVAPWRGLVRFGRAGVEGYKSSKDVKSVAEFAEAVQKGVARGLSEPTVAMKVTGTVTDVGRTMGTTIKTDYTPYDSARELRKAKRYDEVKSKLDEINSLTDAEKEIKALDDYYNAEIDAIKKQVENGTYATYAAAHGLGTAEDEIKKLRGKWLGEKNQRRYDVLKDKIDNNDLKTRSLLQSYAETLVENRGILKESIIENYAKRDPEGNIMYDANHNPIFDLATKGGTKGDYLLNRLNTISDNDLRKAVLEGDEFIIQHLTTSGGESVNFSSAREDSSVSGKSSTAIHQRAMEEEAKKSGK